MKSEIMSIVSAIMLSLLISTQSAIIEKALFDLSTDPFELTDLSTIPSNEALVNDLQLRLDQYRAESRVPVIQASTINKVWKNAGGVVPYINQTKPTKKILPIIEARAGAPNIVFMLLDDVGWNDVSFPEDVSTYLGFATPHLKKLAQRGIVLSHHYTGCVCGPSRAALMTGRYPSRTGMYNDPGPTAILPMDEVTIADEFKLLGYRTALVGKWHLGFEKWDYCPTFRGFDDFYGFYSGSIGYFSKTRGGRYVDLQDQEELVTDPAQLSEHLTTLLQSKAESIILKHAAEYPTTPLFLYYAFQNVHEGGNDGFEAPQNYIDMCNMTITSFDYKFHKDDDGVLPEDQFDQLFAYCALTIMMDEAVANTLCAIEDAGITNNTLIVVASDNGGWKLITGNNYPYRGSKGSMLEGGVHNRALVVGPPWLIPLNRQGSSYDGLVHITDWLPSLLKLASAGSWTGLSNGKVIDGIDIFSAIVSGGLSPRLEIFHNYNNITGEGSMQVGMMKLIINSLDEVNLEPYVNFSLLGEMPLPVCDPANSNNSSGSTSETEIHQNTIMVVLLVIAGALLLLACVCFIRNKAEIEGKLLSVLGFQEGVSESIFTNKKSYTRVSMDDEFESGAQ